mmetsp:Transcript_3809/g.7582  ORF Transcript_3809/g.7582 Transcript_3809/m.7582 type:complete len:293 (+) Transcript_3809:14-892(+)
MLTTIPFLIKSYRLHVFKFCPRERGSCSSRFFGGPHGLFGGFNKVGFVSLVFVSFRWLCWGWLRGTGRVFFLLFVGALKVAFLPISFLHYISSGILLGTFSVKSTLHKFTFVGLGSLPPAQNALSIILSGQPLTLVITPLKVKATKATSLSFEKHTIVTISRRIFKDTFPVTQVILVATHKGAAVFPLVSPGSVTQVILIFTFVEVSLREEEATAVPFLASVMPEAFVDTTAIGVDQATYTLGTTIFLQHNSGIPTQVSLTVRDFLIHHGFTFWFIALFRARRWRGTTRRRR